MGVGAEIDGVLDRAPERAVGGELGVFGAHDQRDVLAFAG